MNQIFRSASGNVEPSKAALVPLPDCPHPEMGGWIAANFTDMSHRLIGKEFFDMTVELEVIKFSIMIRL